MDWLSAAQQLRHEGQPGVLVTVIEVRGHAPREAGAKMVVSRDRCWGSVGGGNLEATAVIRAREMIESGAGAPEICERQLNPHARNEHGSAVLRRRRPAAARTARGPARGGPVRDRARRLRAGAHLVPAADPVCC